MIGPRRSPKSEIMHWKMPLFMPRRLGCEASTATATPMEATGPSASAHDRADEQQAEEPVAMPQNADISEKMTTAGNSTLRRPEPVREEAHRERRDAPGDREDADQVAKVLVA